MAKRTGDIYLPPPNRKDRKDLRPPIQERHLHPYLPPKRKLEPRGIGILREPSTKRASLKGRTLSSSRVSRGRSL
jgi:hypothetical protein